MTFVPTFFCCLPPHCCYSSLCLYIFACRCSQLLFHFKCASDFLRTKKNKLFNAHESRFLCEMAKKQEEKLQVFSTFRFRLYDISREFFWMVFFHLSLSLSSASQLCHFLYAARRQREHGEGGRFFVCFSSANTLQQLSGDDINKREEFLYAWTAHMCGCSTQHTTKRQQSRPTQQKGKPESFNS